MKVLNTIFEKVIWGIIFLFLVIGGSIFLLRIFLAPPPVQVPSSRTQQTTSQSNPTQTPATPESTSSPETASTPTPTETPTVRSTEAKTTSDDSENSKADSSSTTPDATPNPTADSFDNDPETMPALALPNQVAITRPRRLRQGAVLSIYENIDNSSSPDPVNYSPISIKNVSGLTLIDLEKPKFQEVSGYFLVKKTGTYIFLVSYPEVFSVSYDNLRLRIDGQPLSRINGGSVALERGWHKIDLFYMESYGNNGNRVEVKWAKEGGILTRLRTWRES